MKNTASPTDTLQGVEQLRQAREDILRIKNRLPLLINNGPRADTPRTDLATEPEETKRTEALAALKLETTDPAWNPAWSAATTTTGPGGAPGWTAEISIPFDSLPESVAPKPGNGATWRFNVVVENRATVTDAPAAATYSLSPVLVEGGVGKPVRWPALQFQAVKVKKCAVILMARK